MLHAIYMESPWSCRIALIAPDLIHCLITVTFAPVRVSRVINGYLTSTTRSSG